MATFFHGGASEIQPDGLQTLYLMNPGYVGYPSESQSGTNMLLLNQQSTHQQQLLGIPLQQQQHQVSAASSSVDHTRTMSISLPHEISAVHGSLRGGNYSMWTPATANSGVEAAAQELRRTSMAPLAQQGGLSLSLSPQQPSYPSYRQDREEASTGMLIGSKYLSAAQQLLDEVVNVRKGVKDDSLKAIKNQMKANKQHDEEAGEGACAKPASELTSVERQELQMKKAKLTSMLDEVDQTYRRYHQQMQIVVSSFEAIAGFGSARAYTSLALQTISKQFRCLKDAIAAQLRATSKSLGEEEGQIAGGKSEGSSRLRFVDHHLRQQRALQQLGMMQHNAWRPQRGLPERAVSVLRAWLFEHFLHPYPKDTDKLMLAKQTGLTRSQVSNWFINARVRLWKPMVEEMYMEETKDQEPQETNGDDALSNRELNEESGAQNQVEESSGEPKLQSAMIPTSDLAGIIRMKETSAYGEDGGYTQEKYKKARADESSLPMNGLPHAMHVSMDFKPMATNRDFFTMNRRGVEDGGYSFGAFPMGDLGRFDPEQFAPRFSGNGVSLTLGLPHCESLPLSATQPSFLSAETIPLGRRLEMGGAEQEVSRFASAPPPNAYENINMQGRKGFAAPLLPDFVA